MLYFLYDHIYKLKQTAIEPFSIIQLCTASCTDMFEGDILVVYGRGKNCTQSSSVKTSILHVDLVYEDGLMTITTTINDILINQFGSFFFPVRSIRIFGFNPKKRSIWPHRCHKFHINITNHHHETIDPYQYYQPTSLRQSSKFVILCFLPPDMTINELVSLEETYVVGSIVVIVVSFQYNNNNWIFT